MLLQLVNRLLLFHPMLRATPVQAYRKMHDIREVLRQERKERNACGGAEKPPQSELEQRVPALACLAKEIGVPVASYMRYRQEDPTAVQPSEYRPLLSHDKFKAAFRKMIEHCGRSRPLAELSKMQWAQQSAQLKQSKISMVTAMMTAHQELTINGQPVPPLPPWIQELQMQAVQRDCDSAAPAPSKGQAIGIPSWRP